MTNAILLVLIFEGACLAYFIRSYTINKNINNLIITALLLFIFAQPIILSSLDVENLIGNKIENIPFHVNFLAIISMISKIGILISAFFLYKSKKEFI